MEINLSIFSQRSMKVFQSALRFVTHMEHGFIGSEHLLWALASDRGAAGRALRRSGLEQKLLEESCNVAISKANLKRDDINLI